MPEYELVMGGLKNRIEPRLDFLYNSTIYSSKPILPDHTYNFNNGSQDIVRELRLILFKYDDISTELLGLMNLVSINKSTLMEFDISINSIDDMKILQNIRSKMYILGIYIKKSFDKFKTGYTKSLTPVQLAELHRPAKEYDDNLDIRIEQKIKEIDEYLASMDKSFIDVYKKMLCSSASSATSVPATSPGRKRHPRSTRRRSTRRRR